MLKHRNTGASIAVSCPNQEIGIKTSALTWCAESWEWTLAWPSCITNYIREWKIVDEQCKSTFKNICRHLCNTLYTI